MAMKKRNVISVNLTPTNVLFLQNTGYLDRWKRATNKNLSEFVNRCLDTFRGVTHPDKERELQEKLVVQAINAKQKLRDKIEDDIIVLAGKLEGLRRRDKDAGKD